MEDKKLSKAEVEKIKKRVVHNMECEKMTPSEQDLKNIQAVLSDEKTVEQIIAETDKKLKEEGLIK